MQIALAHTQQNAADARAQSDATKHSTYRQHRAALRLVGAGLCWRYPTRYQQAKGGSH
jgi:hypothetical protein